VHPECDVAASAAPAERPSVGAQLRRAVQAIRGGEEPVVVQHEYTVAYYASRFREPGHGREWCD
jgi:hypothetical protein